MKDTIPIGIFYEVEDNKFQDLVVEGWIYISQLSLMIHRM